MRQVLRPARFATVACYCRILADAGDVADDDDEGREHADADEGEPRADELLEVTVRLRATTQRDGHAGVTELGAARPEHVRVLDDRQQPDDAVGGVHMVSLDTTNWVSSSRLVSWHG